MIGMDAVARWPRRAALRLCAGAGLLALIIALAHEAARVLIGSNWHVVIPGRVYRCAQPTGPELEQAIENYGIRTVLNLRGCCVPFPAYLDECRATQRASVLQEDIRLSAGRLPPSDEMCRLVDVLDHTEYPILVHCRRGADRTGLVSAVILLLQTDLDFAEARRQLGLRFGHLALGRPGNLDRFFQIYDDWLKRQGLAHSRATFRRFVTREYCPGECRADIEPVDIPAELPTMEPSLLRVRCTNTSIGTWHFRQASNTGIHVTYVLYDDQAKVVLAKRAGLFDAEVGPGQSMEMALALPAVETAGRYRLWVDLVDEQHCWFVQTGSEPLEQEIVFR
jgi:protein tyrosine/serine phosphatase